MKKRICPQCGEMTTAANYSCPNCNASLSKAEVTEVDDFPHLLQVNDPASPPPGGHCPHCGARTKLGASACRACGQTLSKPSARHTGAHAIPTFLFVLSFFLPTAGIIIGAILLASGGEDERADGKTCLLLGFAWPAILLLIGILRLIA